jgi:aspartate racemase
MKPVGLVGGLGPASTLDYYRLLVARYRERVPDGSYPSIFINSIDLKRFVEGVTAGDWAGITTYLADAVETLARAGAGFGLIAANTPHVVFEAVSRRATIPLLSIVEATCAAAKAMGRRRVALLGTRFTMQARFYPEVFARADITLVTPDPSDQAFVHEKYMGELIHGVFLAETQAGLLDVVDRLRERDGIDAVILGGTELPLILRRDSYHGVPFLDTTKIHVDSALDELLR